ncbi:hypothetical protein SR82_12405 [Klebsiella aerogenes]|nr:hypothetical protein SR83_13480 [Klebsiella aerogenes]KJO46140.1 hypothetical protein SR82_12405 [Klebsiella aerogenes]KJO53371.1 hypothetical protein SR85_06405 [Klebsiella aerogenes]PMT98198.1 hypothetical protein AFB28_00015 [Klebsiella sp. Kd70 TUC-EEAOC]
MPKTLLRLLYFWLYHFILSHLHKALINRGSMTFRLDDEVIQASNTFITWAPSALFWPRHHDCPGD